MEKTYTVNGETFVMRLFTQRDLIRATGRLAILPEPQGKATKKTAEAVRSLDLMDQLLVRCSRNPKLRFDDAPNHDGSLSIDELPQETYDELFKQLAKDSGFNMEAREDIRPSYETGASS